MLNEMADDPIQGSFYGNELQKVDKSADTMWRVETVHKKMKTAGQKEMFVKWKGYPK